MITTASIQMPCSRIPRPGELYQEQVYTIERHLSQHHKKPTHVVIIQ